MLIETVLKRTWLPALFSGGWLYRPYPASGPVLISCRRFIAKARTGTSFYSADGNEPPHVHVEREANRAKFPLGPVRLARRRGFGPAELLRLERLVIEREQLFLRAWDEYFTATE